MVEKETISSKSSAKGVNKRVTGKGAKPKSSNKKTAQKKGEGTSREALIWWTVSLVVLGAILILADVIGGGFQFVVLLLLAVLFIL